MPATTPTLANQKKSRNKVTAQHFCFWQTHNASLQLLVYFSNKLLHLRYTTLIDEIAVVRLSRGDFAVHGCEHDVLQPSPT